MKVLEVGDVPASVPTTKMPEHLKQASYLEILACLTDTSTGTIDQFKDIDTRMANPTYPTMYTW